jgi:isopropylmalate/homocitrate/citramalate synthase
MESNQAQCLKIQDKYADKVETFAKCVVKAAKAVHAVSETSEIKCQEAQKALDSENMDLMRVVIQKYIRKYRVDWSHFSDVRFRYIDKLLMNSFQWTNSGGSSKESLRLFIKILRLRPAAKRFSKPA